ncbi:MAG: AAA family ATPase, partial [Gammaproteobacteria bacterium]|nr:AAA family ATPase [Gammaproteobacteria bacterium]
MPEQRKVVSILFADVVGSTAAAARVDPEVARTQMTRYFKRISEIAETYGGTVEKFAGDAAMVVFGVPSVHDDDAERAVRAALEIRDGSTELTVRVGVNTGEAMTGAADAREFMVSGDVVNVAARLQQGAEAGEVVVGELTHRLTERAIEYQPREPIAAKGKPEPLVAFRAERPRTQVPVQPRGVPGLQASLVGRVRELRLLLDTFARAAEDRTPHLFTLVGAAGIGKSRLIREALTSLADSGARVMFGRCLPYGRGITYWPLIEMLEADMAISLADDHDLALAKLDRRLGEVLSADTQVPALRARLSVMLGFETAEVVMPDTPAARVEKEIGWAVRRYMTAVAQAAPLILVIDDVQWAEPPVLGVVEDLVERLSDAPMVVVCVARPEFVETHPGWSAGKANAATLTLDPLNAIETQTLISRLLEIEALPPELMQEIVRRSAGTPLFCEEFIHMLVDEGLLIREGSSWHAAGSAGAIRVPHGVHAVLAARLDLLPPHERQILQSASVIGERFELGQLRGLTQADGVEDGIESLRRKGL